MYQGGTSVMYNTNTTKTYCSQAGVPRLRAAYLQYPHRGVARPTFDPCSPPTIGIFIAIAVAVLVWVVVNKTVFGYELRACGLNKNAAEYAGIADKRNIVLSMTIAGALAGLGAGLFYLSGSKEWEPLVSTNLPAAGFNGISVALLASSNPIGCIFGHFRGPYHGGRQLYERQSVPQRGGGHHLRRGHLPVRLRPAVQERHSQDLLQREKAETGGIGKGG